MTNLTDKQLELLMAHLDGETDEQEAKDANELLQDTGAKEYFDTFLKMRGLIHKHSSVTAPAGLKDRILAEIKSDINAEAGTEAPIHQLTKASWWAPLVGVAAAVLLVLAVTFGAGDQSNGIASKSAPDVSHQATSEDMATRHGELADDYAATLGDEKKDEQPAADSEAEPTELLKKFGKAERRAAKESPEDTLESLEREELQDGVNSEMEEPLETAKSNAPDTREDLGAGRRKDSDDGAKLGGGGAGAAKPVESKRENSAEAPQRTSRGASTQGGAPKTGSTMPAKERAPKSGGNEGYNKKSRAGHAAKDKADGGDSDREKAADSKMSPPAPPQQGAEHLIEVLSPEGKKLAAQTDLLWVSGIYGQAQLDINDESDVEAISVEVTAGQLPKLIAALKELADKQSYGQIAHIKKQEANQGDIIKLTIRIK